MNNRYAGYPAWVQDLVRSLEDGVALRDSEIRDSYNGAVNGMLEATDASKLMYYYGRKQAMQELMQIFNIEGV